MVHTDAFKFAVGAVLIQRSEQSIIREISLLLIKYLCFN